MIELLLIAGAAAVGGGIGSAVALLALDRRDVTVTTETIIEDDGIGPEDHEFDEAAAAWAGTRDLPEAAPLVAEKLRLMYAIKHGRRWTR